MMVTLVVACGRAEPAFKTEGQGGSSTTPTIPAERTTAAFSTTATTTPAGAGSGVKGTVLFSPVCPVERIPPDPQCAPRPGVADIQLVPPNGIVAAQVRAGTDGQFSVLVAPGSYAVSATAPAPGPGRGCQVEPAQVTVVAGAHATVVVRCDTGIR